MEREEYRDFPGRLIISIIYINGRKASLSLYSGGPFLIIRKGLITCGRMRLLRKRRIGKLI